MAAYSDLGGLGAKQGPPASFVWTLPNFLPVLLPWLAVLALLALPSNRNARAWWIGVPLAALALLGAGLGEASDAAGSEGLSYAVQMAAASSFGLAALWLLGAALGRCRRAFGIGLMALAFAAIGVLALVVSPVWEQLWDHGEPAMPFYLLLFWILSGLVFAGALNLTGWMCRRRVSALRVSLRLLFWLWAMWLVAGGLLVGVVTLGSGGGFEWEGLLLVGPVVLALLSFALMLPFLILSLASLFYRERLKNLLRLPAPAPIAEQGTAP